MGKKVSGTKDKREEMLNKQQKTPKNQSNKQIEAKSPGNPEYQEKLKSKNNIIREIKRKVKDMENIFNKIIEQN